MTNRQAIELLREELRERTADSTLSNQMLYYELIKQAKWLVKREVSGGRIYSNNSFFETHLFRIIDDDTCSVIETNCKMYRTKVRMPELWIDNKGVIIRSVRSLDRSTKFEITTSTSIISKEIDPYQKMLNLNYTYYEDGYLWFKNYNPHYILVDGYFIDDPEDDDECLECKDKDNKCVLFLDKQFKVPTWLEAETFSKTLQQMLQSTMRMQEDEQIDKNTNRKN